MNNITIGHNKDPDEKRVYGIIHFALPFESLDQVLAAITAVKSVLEERTATYQISKVSSPQAYTLHYLDKNGKACKWNPFEGSEGNLDLMSQELKSTLPKAQ